ncbi:MAG TPA: hypothetical protein VGM53_14255, partial [Streptosporangiaceae bacterium]
MARLIHLNGPSRVGKSTLAHRYADNHPGTLCLDVDVLNRKSEPSWAGGSARRSAAEPGWVIGGSGGGLLEHDLLAGQPFQFC